jgi:RHS repeat-associated protein
MRTVTNTNTPHDSVEPGHASNAHKSAGSDALLQERATKSNALEIPKISLPKGGGALKGIDEKFQVNAANGTMSFSVSLPITPGRHGFSPALGLSYNSGAGNGVCGLGWSLDFPCIQRKTDKQLPRYRDTEGDEDVFMLSGVEDLVPHLFDPGEVLADCTVRKYRPRIEGGFSRIEKIDHKDHGTYWRATTRDNVVTIFGRSGEARVADPKDRNRIFQWLPDFSYDDKGNWILYHYKRDSNYNAMGMVVNDETIPHHLYERNRKSGLSPYTNTYLKRVRYGNRPPYFVLAADAYDPSLPADETCYFEVLLDYGEHGNNDTPYLETQPWPAREDAFSNRKAGFEIRTYRLCRRVMMFHHFESEEQIHGYQVDGTVIKSPFGKNYLVRSTELSYVPSSINESGQAEVTYLASITEKGHIRLPDGTYSQSTLPPMDYTYEQLHWNRDIRTVSPESIINAPVGLTNNYQWVDLYGEGISGILTEQGNGWFYKSNLGDLDGDGEVAFTVAKPVMPKPSFTGIGNGVLSLQDLEGNGQRQVVIDSPGLSGFFELTEDNEWKSFQSFERVVNINKQDPNTRLIDLNGDGQPELVVTEDNLFVWYEADGKRGHFPAAYAPKPFDEEQGPAIVFADDVQSIFLADMTGDGLSDIVRIRNGNVCYWPNTGYGAFGAKVSMEGAPLFDYEGDFNPQHLHLADVTGTGPTDIIYLGNNQFQTYLNLGGNSWSTAEKHSIDPFPSIDSHMQLSVVDLLGTGTACIVWSSDLPAYTGRPMRYVDLMNSRKPHVLKKYVNNFGRETRLEYKSSTHYYLKDQQDGRPWITKLPFPVQVVSKSVVEDKITGVRFTADYRYHHGYYDHAEREFRGFGMVEQLDTEEYAAWQKNSVTSKLELSEALYQQPTLTKTWFHTGAFLDGQKILTQYEKEYWFEIYKQTFSDSKFSADEPKLPEAKIVTAKGLTFDINQLTADEYREAFRACKGMIVRQEVFALDGTQGDVESLKRQAKPFSIGTHNCLIQLLQPREKNRYAVFLVTQSETLTIHYERNEKDPRVAHSLNVKLDEMGNVLESASVVYPRKTTEAIDLVIKRVNNTAGLGPDERLFNYNRSEEKQACLDSLQRLKLEQQKTLITYTVSGFTGDILKRECYRLRLPSEVRSFEVTELVKGAGTLYSIDDFINLFSNPKGNVAYHAIPDAGNVAPYYRLIGHVQSTYYDDDVKAELPLGTQGVHGIPYQGYQLVYTPALLKQIFTEVDGGVASDKLPVTAVELENLLSDNDQNADGDKKYSQCRFVHRGDNNWWIRSGITSFYIHAAETQADLRKRFFSPQSYTDPFGAKSTISYYKDYSLLMQAMEDALQNRTEVEAINFRTLTPVQLKDINDNLSEVILDELGLLKASADKGKGNEGDRLNGLTDYTLLPERSAIQNYFTLSDTLALRGSAKNLLQGAGRRFVYDFHRYHTSVGLLEDQLEADPLTSECAKVKYLPIVTGSIGRERHFHDLADSPLQLGFEYADGKGSVVMAKTQAEPGVALDLKVNADCSFVLSEVDTGSQLRWLGNGRTILNNKGNPVKQYEPYFSVNPFFEDSKELVERGVTPIVYYDAVGRVVKTELPNGTYSKVEFDSWHQKTYDANDTVADSAWYLGRKNINTLDPASNQLNANGQTPVKEKAAAEKALLHYNTPSIMHVDTLGRPVLGLEHNRWLEKDTAGTIINWEGFYSTWVSVDIEGNVHSVIDARGNTVMSNSYDMLGHRVFEISRDAGKHWMLNDVSGKPVRSWDSRKHIFSIVYDGLQRPVDIYVQTEGLPAKSRVEKMTYGEGQPNDKIKNLRGQRVEHYDASGKSVYVAFDFKGNSLEVKRQLAAAFEAEVIDWSPGSPTQQLQADTYTAVTEYDALNRMTRLYNWHKSSARVAVYEPRYSERRILVSEDIVVGPQRTATGYSGGTRTTAISNLDYNEKGQRTRMRYGNGTTTRYFYDAQSFRLLQLRTTRPSINGKLPTKSSHLNDSNILQNLYYTYDPVGNITELEDDAYEPVFFKNQMVEPRSRYSYDALYRLTEASGRENQAFDTPPGFKEFNPTKINFPVTEKTLRNYTQLFQYDAVGNIRRMRHVSVTERWTRSYDYHADSNRLRSTSHGVETINYDHDAHGNMLNYSNSPVENRFKWDYRDMPFTISVGGGGNAYYQYDGNRQRSRKHIKRAGNVTEDRLYLEGFELYQYSEGGIVKEEIETYHVFSDSQRVLLVEDVRQTNNNNLNTGVLFRYQYSNHLGSVGLEADGNANIISYEEYHPYGTVAYEALNGSIKAAAKRYRFTGMERDEENGLFYCGARYYAAWLTRWVSPDPSGTVDGPNLYNYVAANPIRFHDPTGRTLHPDMLNAMREDYDKSRAAASEAAEKRDWDEYRRKLILERNYDVDVSDSPDLQALKDRRIAAERDATKEALSGEDWYSGGVGAGLSSIAERKAHGVDPNLEDAAIVARTLANTAVNRTGNSEPAAGAPTTGKPPTPAAPSPAAPKPAAAAAPKPAATTTPVTAPKPATTAAAPAKPATPPSTTTASTPTVVPAPRKPQGFDTGRATPGRNVKPGTLEGLESNKVGSGGAYRKKPLTRQEQENIMFNPPSKHESPEYKAAQARLRAASINDPDVPASIRGWLRNEQRQRGNNPRNWRNPPGYDTGHINPNDDTRLRWETASQNRSRGAQLKR